MVRSNGYVDTYSHVDASDLNPNWAIGTDDSIMFQNGSFGLEVRFMGALKWFESKTRTDYDSLTSDEATASGNDQSRLNNAELNLHWWPCANDRYSLLVEKHLGDIQKHHPDIEIEKYSVQKDHVHLIIVIPPKYSVSEIIGKIKANTSREIRRRFAWVKKVYWHNEFWSPGFFSSTVGINEEVIKRYIEFQEKIDKGQLQLSFDL